MKKVLSIILALIILMIQVSAFAASYTVTVKEQGVRLRNSSGQVICEIPVGKKITVNSYSSYLDMFSVTYNGTSGYIKGTGLDISKAELQKNVTATPKPTKTPSPKPSKTATPKPTVTIKPTPIVSANRSTEEMTFLGMKFGSTTYSAAYSEIIRQGVAVTPKQQNVSLHTPISCSSHSDDLSTTSLAFDYSKSEYGTGRCLYVDYLRPYFYNGSLSIGGIQVTEVDLRFCKYNYLFGAVSEIKDENSYWLYSGTYEFEYQGDSSKQESKNTYGTLMKKLTNIYGEPAMISESTSEVIVGYRQDNPIKQPKAAYHSIWLGANNTGIILKYEPSVHIDATVKPPKVEERYVVYLTYGLTSMDIIIASVNDYINGKNAREGL